MKKRKSKTKPKPEPNWVSYTIEDWIKFCASSLPEIPKIKWLEMPNGTLWPHRIENA